MKHLSELIGESLVSEAKVIPIDDEAKALVKEVVKKYRIRGKAQDDVPELVNQICNSCKDWGVPRPHINDFYTDHDTLDWMRSDYDDKTLASILVDDELISVEINGYGCYNWNNDDKCWEEI